MSYTYKRAIFWFKRNLRVEDNKALFKAIQESGEIIPIFIFIPSLLKKFGAYDKRLGFVIDSVQNLNYQLERRGSKLFCYYDEPTKVIDALISRYSIDAVFTNKAFSYSGGEFEKKVENLCRGRGIKFIALNDNFLCDIENIPYKKVFTYFYRDWLNYLDLEICPEVFKISTPPIDEPTVDIVKRNTKF